MAKERVQEEFTEIPLRPTAASVQQEPVNLKVINVADTMAPVNPQTKHEIKHAAVELKPATNGGWSIEKTAQNSHAVAEKSSVTDKVQKGWTLQLGSFKNSTNVTALVEQLRHSGFDAYTIPSTPQAGKITKVFVGPDITKQRIEQLKPRVEKLTHLKGRIIPFDPLAQ